MKFVLYEDGVVLVFDAVIPHNEIALDKVVIGAGFIPPIHVLECLASSNASLIDKLRPGMLQGVRWRSSTLTIETPMSIRNELLEFFVLNRDAVYTM